MGVGGRRFEPFALQLLHLGVIFRRAFPGRRVLWKPPAQAGSVSATMGPILSLIDEQPPSIAAASASAVIVMIWRVRTDIGGTVGLSPLKKMDLGRFARLGFC